MKSKLMHNLGLKIMAVLISVVLWMLAVDINDPVINKYINKIFKGEFILIEEFFIVSN